MEFGILLDIGLDFQLGDFNIRNYRKSNNFFIPFVCCLLNMFVPLKIFVKCIHYGYDSEVETNS